MEEFIRRFEAAPTVKERREALLGTIKTRFEADGEFLELFVQVLPPLSRPRPLPSKPCSSPHSRPHTATPGLDPYPWTRIEPFLKP